MRFNGTRPLDTADASERFAEDFRLIAELRLIRHVLVLAAAAASKVRARSRHAIRRWFHDALQPPANEFLFPRGRFNLNKFARKNQRDKYRVAVVMRQAVAAIHKFFYSNFHSGRFPLRGV